MRGRAPPQVVPRCLGAPPDTDPGSVSGRMVVLMVRTARAEVQGTDTGLCITTIILVVVLWPMRGRPLHVGIGKWCHAVTRLCVIGHSPLPLLCHQEAQ